MNTHISNKFVSLTSSTFLQQIYFNSVASNTTRFRTVGEKHSRFGTFTINKYFTFKLRHVWIIQ